MEVSSLDNQAKTKLENTGEAGGDWWKEVVMFSLGVNFKVPG